jgi:hypothetical protein
MIQTASELCAALCASIDKCTESIRASTRRLQERNERLQLVQPSSAISEMRRGMAVEPLVLPKHKRRGTFFFENGEILEFPKSQTHTVREPKTTFFRSQYNRADLNMLSLVRDAQLLRFSFEDSERWLISRRNGRTLPRKRIDADPDPVCTEWKERPARLLTAEQMIREQFTGRALQRELARLQSERK